MNKKEAKSLVEDAGREAIERYNSGFISWNELETVEVYSAFGGQDLEEVRAEVSMTTSCLA
jgi:hypothetical protein